MQIVYITATSESEAREISRALITERLAACVNIHGKIESMYWWKGKLEESAEIAIIAKTEERLVDKLIEKVKSIHSAKVPCVVSFPITKGSKDYLTWLSSELNK